MDRMSPDDTSTLGSSLHPQSKERIDRTRELARAPEALLASELTAANAFVQQTATMSKVFGGGSSVRANLDANLEANLISYYCLSKPQNAFIYPDAATHVSACLTAPLLCASVD